MAPPSTEIIPDGPHSRDPNKGLVPQYPLAPLLRIDSNLSTCQLLDDYMYGKGVNVSNYRPEITIPSLPINGTGSGSLGTNLISGSATGIDTAVST